MKKALGAVVVAACFGLAWALVSRSVTQLREARVEFVSQLSRSTAQLRTFDRLQRIAEADRLGATAAVDRLLGQSVNTAEREMLNRLRACLTDDACSSPVNGFFEPLELVSSNAVQAAWAHLDEAEASLSSVLGIALGLGLTACLLTWLTTRSPIKVRDVPSPINDPMMQLLRNRIDALYAARTQLSSAERFASMGVSTSGLIHSVKTPLARIVAAAQLAQLRVGQTTPDLTAALDEVIRQARELSDHVQQALAPKSTLVQTPLLEVSRAAVSALAASFEAKHLRLEVSGQELQARIDPVDFMIALRNLLENAIDASEGGSEIRLRVSAVEAPSSEYAVSIEDAGGGLGAETLAGRLDVTTKEHGSGIGLAIVRSLAERAGGRLVLENRPEGGATATLFLPRAST